MDKKLLKKQIAELAYNVAFGAKRHFASFDILTKLPTYFGVFTSVVGLLFLVYENRLVKPLSVLLTTMGFGIVYLNFYNEEAKKKFETVGKELSSLYQELRSMYDRVDSLPESSLLEIERKILEINARLQDVSISKHVFGSSVFAHFKLFGESQQKWFVDELGLTFWKDKIPFVIKFGLYALILLVAGFVIYNFTVNSSAADCIRSKFGN